MMLFAASLAGYSQAQAATPAPNPVAGTYKDATLSIPQRLTLANSVVNSGTDAADVAAAAEYMLTARPVGYLLTAYPNFANQVTVDPTLSGTISEPPTVGYLFEDAVNFDTDAIPTLAGKIAWLQPLISSTLYTARTANFLAHKYGGLCSNRAAEQLRAGDASGALATALPVIGVSPYPVYVVFQAKLNLRSADLLSWAKLIYFTQPFGKTQDGINAVTSAYRALDGNLVRANQYVAYEISGSGTDPLAGVALPSVTLEAAWGDPLYVNCFNLALSGSSTAALVLASNNFASAPIGPKLNAATAFMAQWLRNLDGNFIRANAWVAAQVAGQPFNIPELSGTSQ